MGILYDIWKLAEKEPYQQTDCPKKCDEVKGISSDKKPSVDVPACRNIRQAPRI